MKNSSLLISAFLAFSSLNASEVLSKEALGQALYFDVNLSKFDLSKLGNVEIDEIHFYIKGTCEKCLKKKN